MHRPLTCNSGACCFWDRPLPASAHFLFCHAKTWLMQNKEPLKGKWWAAVVNDSIYLNNSHRWRPISVQIQVSFIAVCPFLKCSGWLGARSGVQSIFALLKLRYVCSEWVFPGLALLPIWLLSIIFWEVLNAASGFIMACADWSLKRPFSFHSPAFVFLVRGWEEVVLSIFPFIWSENHLSNIMQVPCCCN